MTRRRALPALLLVALAAAVAPSPASAAPAGLLVVDKDRMQCRNAGFVSIQAAVTAAQPGDTIKVCPDLYLEQVDVNKPDLALTGTRGSARDGRARNCFEPQPPDPTRDAIVNGATWSFRLRNNRIRVDSFVIAGEPPRGNFVGVATDAQFSGYEIEDNIIQNNVLDIVLGTSGAERSDVTRNCLRNSDTGIEHTLFPSFIVTVGLRNALIQNNYWFRHSFTGIYATLPNSDVEIRNNTSLDDGGPFAGFLEIWNSTGNQIVANRVTDSNGDGAMVLRNRHVDLSVHHNVIEDGLGSGISFTQGGPGQSTGVEVMANHVRRMARDGFQVASGSLMSSFITNNHFTGNGRSGIRIETGVGPLNGNNQILNNMLTGNAATDCHDDTVGTGTAGTANFWEHNHGNDENRPGLCVR